jgi:hypothetical protein
MSVSQLYPFNDQADYSLSNAVVTGGVAKLALVDNAGLIFANTFDDDTGFTYDSSKAEFTAGTLQQVDKTPTNSLLAAKYTSDANLNWHKNSGSPTGTLNGAPTISGGKIVCTGSQGVHYQDALIGSAAQNTGTIKFKYTPNYTGSPPSNVNLASLIAPSGNNDRILITHSPSGDNFRLTVNSDTGAAIVATAAIGGAFLPTAAQEYEIELAFDVAAGVFRIFVDGALHGTSSPGAYTRGTTATRLVAGATANVYNLAEASFDDVVLFSNVQHTATYTPGYSLTDFIYVENKVDGPNFTYTGVGTVQSVDDGTVVETGSPRYIIGGLYWNGSVWVASNGSYAQANDSTTALSNLTEIDLGGSGILPWAVVFPDSNTQSTVDSFNIEVTGQKYSPSGYLEPVVGLNVSGLVDYSQTIVVPAGTDVKVILKIDNILTYHNGSAWVTSNGSQSNTASEVADNAEDLVLGSNSEIFIRWILTSTEDNATSELQDSTVEYEFGAIETDPDTCIVYGYYRDIAGNPISGASVTFSLIRANKEYTEANKNIIEGSVVVTTNSAGYFQSSLIRSSEYSLDRQYKIEIKKTSSSLITSKNPDKTLLTFAVPDSSTKDITDLLPTV